jgi:hypothetical protein
MLEFVRKAMGDPLETALSLGDAHAGKPFERVGLLKTEAFDRPGQYLGGSGAILLCAAHQRRRGRQRVGATGLHRGFHEACHRKWYRYIGIFRWR